MDLDHFDPAPLYHYCHTYQCAPFAGNEVPCTTSGAEGEQVAIPARRRKPSPQCTDGMCKRNPDSLRVAPAGAEQAECCQLSYAFEVAGNRLKVKDPVASAKLLQQAEQYDEVCIHCTHWAIAERKGCALPSTALDSRSKPFCSRTFENCPKSGRPPVWIEVYALPQRRPISVCSLRVLWSRCMCTPTIPSKKRLLGPNLPAESMERTPYRVQLA